MSLEFLSTLEAIIDERARELPDDSYTAKLFNEGPKRIAQKLGEEGVEVALASVTGDRDEVLEEAADLIYHLLVLLRSQEIAMAEVVSTLERRHSS